MKILWYLVILFHIVIMVANGICMLMLPFIIPYPANIPISIILWYIFIRISFLTETCPVTVIENWIREKLGLQKIDGFIKHYFIRRITRKRG
jgi:hypothetical protein